MLSTLPPNSVVICNEPQTMLWNMDKTYLRELSQRGLPEGVALPKTLWFRWEEVKEDLPSFDLKEEMARCGFGRRAVIKPLVGAGKADRNDIFTVNAMTA